MNFDFLKPNTLEELVQIMKCGGEDVKILAGGTDLIPSIKAEKVHPKAIVSIAEIKELQKITVDPVEGLTFGCGVTLHELENNKSIQENYKALYEGIHSMASTQIRNMGTVVGNICNAVPSADTAPALIALDGEIHIKSFKGERTVKAEEFFTGVCTTVLKPEEIVSDIHIPAPRGDAKSKYTKFTVRRALELAMAGVAVRTEEKDGTFSNVRIALGAVAPTPKLAENAMELLEGKPISRALIEDAAVKASEDDSSPISDKRASEEYRREIVRICTRDALIETSGLMGGNR